jgi:hypothetical protein
MVEILSLDEAVIAEWLAIWSEHDPFCSDAALALQELITSDHFMVVMTLMRSNVRRSLVFRTLRTLRPAGRKLQEALRKGTPLAAYYHRQPIDIAHMQDMPIITENGQRALAFEGALQSAITLAEWAKCPKIFVFDGSRDAPAHTIN